MAMVNRCEMPGELQEEREMDILIREGFDQIDHLRSVADRLERLRDRVIGCEPCEDSDVGKLADSATVMQRLDQAHRDRRDLIQRMDCVLEQLGRCI